MAAIKGKNTISGKEGLAIVIIDNIQYELFYLKSFEATLEKQKSEIKRVGRRFASHKSTGVTGTGSVVMDYYTPVFKNKMIEYINTGVDFYFDMIVKVSDPASDAGTETVVLKDCNLDQVMVSKLDGDSDDPLEDNFDFTFEGIEYETSFNEYKKPNA